jgi:hypothetical protein
MASDSDFREGVPHDPAPDTVDSFVTARPRRPDEETEGRCVLSDEAEPNDISLDLKQANGERHLKADLRVGAQA